MKNLVIETMTKQEMEQASVAICALLEGKEYEIATGEGAVVLFIEYSEFPSITNEVNEIGLPILTDGVISSQGFRAPLKVKETDIPSVWPTGLNIREWKEGDPKFSEEVKDVQ